MNLKRKRSSNRTGCHRGQAQRRLFDVAVALLGLLILAPVAILIAILIRWRLGRPVLFRQPRLGLHGREFTMLKFRTMLPASYKGQPDYERITNLGRALRTTSLDEIPQLFNVLRGQMSIIGPRPGLLMHLERYCSRQRGRLAVRPGITGWAQVNGRNSISLQERIDLDLWYIEYRNWRLDARILIATVLHLIWPRDVVGPGGENPDFPRRS